MTYWSREDGRRDGATRPRCSLSQDLEWIISESVFKHLSPETTPEQYRQAIESLDSLVERFKAMASDPFHFASSSGALHRCVKDSYEAAVFYLKSRMVLAPVPKPEPPPAPRPKRRSLADVLKQYEEVSEAYYGDREDDAGTDTATGKAGY